MLLSIFLCSGYGIALLPSTVKRWVLIFCELFVKVFVGCFCVYYSEFLWNLLYFCCCFLFFQTVDFRLSFVSTHSRYFHGVWHVENSSTVTCLMPVEDTDFSPSATAVMFLLTIHPTTLEAGDFLSTGVKIRYFYSITLSIRRQTRFKEAGTKGNTFLLCLPLNIIFYFTSL